MRPLRSSILILLVVFNTTLTWCKPPAKQLYPIVWKWLKGNSDSVYYFSQTSHPQIISNVQDAYQVRRAREFWYQKNMSVFIEGKRQWLGMNNFLGRYQTLRGVWRSGIDMVEQTIGGFTVHIHPVNKDSVEFTVLDIKSRWSLFLHLPFVKNVAHSSTDKKIMMNCRWIFTWREAISNSLFYQRQYNERFRKRAFTGHNF